MLSEADSQILKAVFHKASLRKGEIIMAFIPVNQVKAEKKANGKGEITINHLLGANELGGNDMFAKVVIPPGCSIGYHEHHGNTETYHILQGEALYNDNGTETKVGAGTTTFCPDGEGHSIENCGTEDLVFIALITKTI